MGHDPSVVGDCAAPLQVRFGSIGPGCGGGGATLTLTALDERCTGPFGPFVRIVLGRAPTGPSVPVTLTLSAAGGTGDGTAEVCLATGCVGAPGTLTFTAIDPGGTASVDVSLDAAGMPITATGARITTTCETAPGCP